VSSIIEAASGGPSVPTPSPEKAAAYAPTGYVTPPPVEPSLPSGPGAVQTVADYARRSSSVPPPQRGVVDRTIAWLFPPSTAAELMGPAWRRKRVFRPALAGLGVFFFLLLLGLIGKHAHPSLDAHDIAAPPPPVTPAPPELLTRLNDAQTHIVNGDHAGARAILVELESQHPDSGQVHYTLGNLDFADGDKAGGLAEYKKAIDADPGYRGNPALLAQVSPLVSDKDVGSAALDVLCDQIGAPALPVLVQLAQSPDADPSVRARARDTVIKLGAQSKLDLVASYGLDLQQDTSCDDRRQAVEELRDLGDKRAVPLLRQARDRTEGLLGLSHPNDCIYDDIVDALKVLVASDGGH
jgi:hypothetical protein